ncbi:hypothetical protein XU18_0227 [Perkinsela sp. CCAP 1560/4]|nr:hypothetical protein XU18_0227 [Perkinsela sp. CCAP 1560/4]|eukprot:KNH09542.1 hypothetical protein XU18_0227 [Perkinsela sp. CCAP 1560/4]
MPEEYRLVKWRQDNGHLNIDLIISIPPKDPQSPRKFKVKADGENLEVSLNDATVFTWVLFDSVQDDPEWETHSEELHISLTKTSEDPWKSALRNPVPYPTSTESADSVMLTDNMLNAIIGTETYSFSKFHEQEKVDSDLDSILEDVLASETSMSPHEAREKEYYNSLVMEIQSLQENTSTDEPENKALTERIIQYDEKILSIRSSEPSLTSMLDATEFELVRLKAIAGDTAEAEEEAYLSAAEESLSGSELFAHGIVALEQQNGAEGLRFLRLAALRHNHPQSVINLVRIYMESEMEAKALQILLKSARQSTDPLINFTMAQMFDNGVNGLRPLFALALYFYQRAASQGETTAMCFASALHLRGACTAAEGHHKVSGSQRAAQWMRFALERGSIFAYKLELELHLGTSRDMMSNPLIEGLAENTSVSPSYHEAHKYYQLLNDTSREMLKQIPQLEKRLNELRPIEAEGMVKEKESTSVRPQSAPVAQSVSSKSDESVVTTSNTRKSRLQRASRAAREGMATHAPRSEIVQAFSREKCEKWALYSALAGSAYVLAFPLRVIAFPWAVQTLENIASVFV